MELTPHGQHGHHVQRRVEVGLKHVKGPAPIRNLKVKGKAVKFWVSQSSKPTAMHLNVQVGKAFVYIYIS